MNRTTWPLPMLLLCACLGASAAPIYRCGPDGRVFSQVPCTGGQIVESSDPRSAVQRAEARRVAAQERQNAAEMERSRRADETAARAANDAPAGINARPVAQEAAASATERGPRGRRSSKPTANDKDFVAVVPGSRGKRP